MSEKTEHQQLIEKAEAVTDRASARDLIDGLYDYGVSFHPEESFDQIITNETGERTFTDHEAKVLDEALAKARDLVGDNALYDYGLEVILADSDKELLEQAGINWQRLGKRYVPADDDSCIDYLGAIPKLLKHAGISFQENDRGPGYLVGNGVVMLWEHYESGHKGAAERWTFAVRDLDLFTNPVPDSTRSTRSAFVFLEEVKKRLERD